ncbi:nischarin-like [Agrilus planipennis]|uniref:Nischarin-like n=1 Tax=Agrilus planipennis TaxID=224129 RepID=A0A1W4XB04_AGRPL|nr:nischarin-like [Agrilus planipennis]XP_025834365.1 nischarin-like [Agrilus planipennis]XP_025834366.1 nischarin-like [Agrilus planipennis]
MVQIRKKFMYTNDVDMACYWLHVNDTLIKIPDVSEQDGIIFYNVEVKIGEVKWKIMRRYNDFFELHQQLVNDHGVSKDLLPPKKVILNKSKAFIESRREALQIYLQKLLQYLKSAMPKEFWEFLEFHEYDIYFILQGMAIKLSSNSFKMSSEKEHEFTPLQLHAITKCLKQAVLEFDRNGKDCDLSNILDFFSELNSMVLCGSGTCYKNSNIIPNSLPFELSSFKYLESLVIFNVNLDNIYCVDNLRNTVKKLGVHQTQATKISNILQCDTVHKTVVDEKQSWNKLVEIDFTCNAISEVDGSVGLAPLLTTMTLSKNKLTFFPDLSCLTNLKDLNLSKNMITHCENLHTKLGNVVKIDLSQNRLTNLKGFSKLYSLESLDISHNSIYNIEEAKNIGDLPCLEDVVLNGNPVAAIVDYRIKILENFGERAKEICLDNEMPTQSELDKASVLRALKLAKDKNRSSKNEN